LSSSGEVYIWGTPNLQTPTKIQNAIFTDVKVGGNFTVFTDSEGQIL
jgi:alpha-tubulin suppressor-like RCC1 family protein